MKKALPKTASLLLSCLFLALFIFLTGRLEAKSFAPLPCAEEVADPEVMPINE